MKQAHTNPDTEIKGAFPFAEAYKLINDSRNRQLFISVPLNAPVAGDTDKYFPLYGNVKVTRDSALLFLDNTYGTRFKTEALVNLHISQNCLFIG